MKKIFIISVLILIFCSCGNNMQSEDFQKEPEQNSSGESGEINSETEEDVPYVNGWTPDFKPSDFETDEEYYEDFLDEFVNHLEPLEYFETEKEYPEVILEIFDLMMEQEASEIMKCEELVSIDVLGDEKEFYVTYKYISKEGYEEFRSVRVRKTEDGKYGLLGRGGGPLGYGLEKSELTLEDIL